jgi:hypothetical protein
MRLLRKRSASCCQEVLANEGMHHAVYTLWRIYQPGDRCPKEEIAERAFNNLRTACVRGYDLTTLMCLCHRIHEP